MTEKYPFFREEDERARAVIGEEAAQADLGGAYQKPYAVLTQKRLYCKNEQGNFITDAAGVRSAGKGRLPGHNWFLWAAAACLALALGLLSLWYFAHGGTREMDAARDHTQRIIDHYQSVESQVPEIEKKIRYYEEAQKARDEAQKEWDEKGYSAVQGRIEALTNAIEKQKEANKSYQTGIEDAKWTISRSGTRYLGWGDPIQLVSPEQLENARHNLERYEALLLKEQEKLRDLQRQLDGMKDQKTAMQETRARIERNQASMDSIRYDEHRMTLENHQADAPRYQEARDMQGELNLLMPLFWAMTVAFVVLLVCALIKAAKTAVFAAWAASLLGLALFWALSGLDVFSFALLLASLAVLPLGLFALWSERKKTVFQIVHATGAFQFAPSLYPAEEFKSFAAQVEELKAEDAVHV